MKPAIAEQKTIVADFAELFDREIRHGREHGIAQIIDQYNRADVMPPANVILLRDVFFIWIGRIRPSALEYVDIWRESGCGDVTIYYDGDFLLYNCYAETLRAIFGIDNDASLADRIAVQDRARVEIDRRVQAGCSIDQALIAFVRRFSPGEARRLERECQAANDYLSGLGATHRLVDIRTVPALFEDDFFLHIYHLELVLRANAAAAADILRLLLLYRCGGMYVDVDTLPSLAGIYGPLSGSASVNVQNVVRAEYFLRQRRRRRGNGDLADADIGRYERYLDQRDASLLPAIKDCAGRHAGSPLPFRPAAVHENLIAVAALETPYEYNNNVLAAAKRSKLVKILLREIRRRYRFLFANGFDRAPRGDADAGGYLGRLANYRHDALDGRDNVTLFLTGPILLLEVMLGVANQLLPLSRDVSPLALSYAFRLDCLAVAYRDQTCYTPEHMKSSWR